MILLSKDLTQAELKVIQQVGFGLSNKEIAQKLYLSEGTVRNYVSIVLSKLELRDRTQLAISAIRKQESQCKNLVTIMTRIKKGILTLVSLSLVLIYCLINDPSRDITLLRTCAEVIGMCLMGKVIKLLIKQSRNLKRNTPMFILNIKVEL